MSIPTRLANASEKIKKNALTVTDSIAAALDECQVYISIVRAHIIEMTNNHETSRYRDVVRIQRDIGPANEKKNHANTKAIPLNESANPVIPPLKIER